jgi:hypothetical protein
MEALSLVARASKLLVVQGEDYDHRRRRSHVVLHDERDPATIRRLARSLAGLEPDGSQAWTQSPVASLVFLDGGEPPLLKIGLLSPGWVRLPGPAADARLADPALWSWLAGVGVRLDR